MLTDVVANRAVVLVGTIQSRRRRNQRYRQVSLQGSHRQKHCKRGSKFSLTHFVNSLKIHSATNQTATVAGPLEGVYTKKQT